MRLPEVVSAGNEARLIELKRLAGLLADSGINMYLMGSWALSALNGLFVKDHDGDVDMVVPGGTEDLEKAVEILVSRNYSVLEERIYNRAVFVEKWYRLQGPVIQVEIGDGFKSERIPAGYHTCPVTGCLYGSTYNVVPLPWLVESYSRKQEHHFVRFLEQQG